MLDAHAASSLPNAEFQAVPTWNDDLDLNNPVGQAEVEENTEGKIGRSTRRRLRIAEARAKAKAILADKGHRDRRAGGFAVPEADVEVQFLSGFAGTTHVWIRAKGLDGTLEVNGQPQEQQVKANLTEVIG